jgi:UDPglucose 6-dehydrogenase
LQPVVDRNYRAQRLHFTTSPAEAIAGTRILFIAVGTPPGRDQSADPGLVLDVARQIGRHIEGHSVIAVKSTVPVGTAGRVAEAVRQELGARGVAIPFEVVVNPEFLREGCAVSDFMHPDRVVVGCESEGGRRVMRDLYGSFVDTPERILIMGAQEAEMAKYAANAMLAARISFMNEIAGLCDRLGVDVESVRLTIGSDRRIGHAFTFPGCGYGGSCLPKDVKALIRLAEEHACDPVMLRAIDARNDLQKHVLFDKITRRFGNDLGGLTFGVWGLSFKPDTDDLREASSTALIQRLVEAGAKVKAHDPVAMQAARRQFPQAWRERGKVELVDHHYAAAEKADALVLVTEWQVFRDPDLDHLGRVMQQKVIFDGRNLYDPASVRERGFEYTGIGR